MICLFHARGEPVRRLRNYMEKKNYTSKSSIWLGVIRTGGRVYKLCLLPSEFEVRFFFW